MGQCIFCFLSSNFFCHFYIVILDADSCFYSESGSNQVI